MLLLPLASARYTAGTVATQRGDTCGGGLAAFQPPSPTVVLRSPDSTAEGWLAVCLSAPVLCRLLSLGAHCATLQNPHWVGGVHIRPLPLSLPASALSFLAWMKRPLGGGHDAEQQERRPAHLGLASDPCL